MYSTIPVDQIDDNPAQPRQAVDQAKLRELAESIRAVGLLQPIGVVAFGDRYQLVFGWRRLLAHRWLGAREVACRVLTTEEADRLSAATAENVVREDLNPVEEARAIVQMLDAQGRSVREVAAALGKSESWVRARREILLWPEEFVLAIARGELSPSVARELVAVEDEAWRAVYFRSATENGVTAAQARMWRLEWEQAAALQATQPAPPEGTVPAPSPIMPRALCNLCKWDKPITELTFARLCGDCAAAVAQSGRREYGAGGDGPA